MASNEYVNKVQFGDTTIMDITDTTADSGDVIEGEVFYSKSGAKSVGTLGDATTSAHGLMSAADKSKLDGIAANANTYVLPVMSNSVLGGAYIDASLSSITIWHNPANNKDILMLNAANAATIKAGTSLNQPATVFRQHESVFYGLSKVAGVDLANETVTLGTYPDTSKTAIQAMLGIINTAATTSAMGYMSAVDKQALEEWKSLRLSVDAQGYVCQTVEVNE